MKNKVLTLLLSLAISFGLWLYVVTVISPESETTIDNVPVELVGSGNLDKHDLIIVSPTNDLRVNLKLGGSRSDLSKLNNSNVTVIVDVSKINQAGEHQLGYSVSFQSGTAEVLEQDPANITLTVVDKMTKTVPVEPVLVGVVPSGYEADRDNVRLDHTTVTVSGPKETIEKVEFARVAIDVTGKMISFDDYYPMTLCGEDRLPIASDSFVTVNLDEIWASVQVYQIKRVQVLISEDYTGSGLQENTATITQNVRDVTLIGNSEDLEKVADVLPFTITLQDFEGTTTITLKPDLPDGVQCKESIEVHIVMPEMGDRVLTVGVDQFETFNVPEGLTVRVTEPVEVTVRGPIADLEKISAADIVGKVDCSNVTTTSGYASVVYTVAGYEHLYVRGAWENVFIEVRSTEN